MEQLQSLAEEARSLKDEMDILRHTQDKVARYEATIESYKKKLGTLAFYFVRFIFKYLNIDILNIYS